MNLVNYLKEQKEFSEKAFGPMGDPDCQNIAGLIDHIEKELEEIKRDPMDVFEWIDVVILAFDGALRMGFTPEEISQALKDKLEINKSRKWPDWRTAEPGKAIEHIR